MKARLYEYKGQMLSQMDIAKLEGINRYTLSDWYKKTKNMEEAVIRVKKIQEQRNIEYYDQTMSLSAISEKEGIVYDSLKRLYDKTKDIYLAVKLTKIEKIKRQLLLYEFSTVLNEWSIEELKEMMNLYQISDEEITTIVCKLYNSFQNGVINPGVEYLKHQNYIIDIIINDDISDEEINLNENLSNKEKIDIKNKRYLLKQLKGTDAKTKLNY